MRGHPQAASNKLRDRQRLPAKYIHHRVGVQRVKGGRGKPDVGPCGGDSAAPFEGVYGRCDVCENKATIRTEDESYYCAKHSVEDAQGGTVSQLIAQLVEQIEMLEAHVADSEKEIGILQRRCGL